MEDIRKFEAPSGSAKCTIIVEAEGDSVKTTTVVIEPIWIKNIIYFSYYN